jgi:type II secretory pathway pseudopilin PulG
MKKQTGITIIEIILYIGLLSIFMLVLLDIFMGGLNLQFESQATSAVQTDGQFIMARLMSDLKNADSLTTPAALGASSSTLVFVSGGVTYTYSLGGGVLSLTRSGETLALNSLETNITSINFTRLGNAGGKPTIKVDFTIDSKTLRSGAKPETRTYQTTFGLR